MIYFNELSKKNSESSGIKSYFSFSVHKVSEQRTKVMYMDVHTIL